MKTFTLHLIRHGITQGNLDGLYVGSGTDLPLCPQGVQQLNALKARFPYPDVNTVFVSPLLRAKQSADLLFPGARQLEIQDLREMNFGCFEGRAMKELLTDPLFKAWLDPHSRDIPAGAEDRQAFADRCGQVLMKLFEFMIKTGLTEAACVTHGGVLMNMLALHALPRHKPDEWMADPGCGYTVQCSVEMWMRDKLVEAVEVQPLGYLDESAES